MSQPRRVLLGVQDAGLRSRLCTGLVDSGRAVTVAETCEEVLEQTRVHAPHLVVLDSGMIAKGGPDGFSRMRERLATLPVVLVPENFFAEEHDSIGSALTAQGSMGTGEMLASIERILTAARAGAENRKRRLAPLDPFVGHSPAIRALAEEALQALASESPVLIQGETGSGKGVLAGWLHRHGPRSHEPFVDVTCSAMFGATMDAELFGQDRGVDGGGAQQGLLETADRGTLYLDGVTDLDLGVQAKLLRVIEDHRFRRLGDPRDRSADVRVVASTVRDLGQRVAEGLFRPDLQYRLDVLRLRVPPLRERPGDVPHLARRIVAQLSLSMRRTEPGLSPASEHLLSTQAWPGNIRQLRNELERALQRCAGDVLQPEHFTLTEDRPPGLDLSTVQGTLEEVERAYIERVLRETGRVEAAAQRLGVPRSTLYQKIRNYGIERPR